MHKRNETKIIQDYSLDDYNRYIEHENKRRNILRLIGIIVIGIIAAATTGMLCHFIIKAASPSYTDKPLVTPKIDDMETPYMTVAPWSAEPTMEPVSEPPEVSTNEPETVAPSSEEPSQSASEVPVSTPMATAAQQTPMRVTPTPTAVPTYTPAPTLTSIPTSVPTPSNTPAPTELPTNTPDGN